MNRKIVVILLSFIVAFMSCKDKPTEPDMLNPLDTQNKQTAGDPFGLAVTIGNGGVLLEWEEVDVKSITNYYIYRSAESNSGFLKMGQVTFETRTFTDTTVQNGNSYWYKVSALDENGQESNYTHVASIRINTEPVIDINNGNKYITSGNIDLTILAMTAKQMWISNNKDFLDGEWEAYSTRKSWSTSEIEGQKIIYLKVKYDNDEISTTSSDTVYYDTTLPVAAFSISPEIGVFTETPFQFDASPSTDNLTLDEDMNYRWDWDNDGIFDTGWTHDEITYHNFDIGGGYTRVKLQVMDGAGWQAEIVDSVYVNTAPVAKFDWDYDRDNVKVVYFDASKSTDLEDGQELQYRWDWEGDGVWDTDFVSLPEISHEFGESNDTVSVVLQVQDLHQGKSTKVNYFDFLNAILFDIDGNLYKVVCIGNQWWTVENLKTTHYRNGEPIEEVTDNAEWTTLTRSAYCAWGNFYSLVEEYGLLYNGYAIEDSRNLAPEGWHVATDEDWKELEMFAGMSKEDADYYGPVRGTTEGAKLKEEGYEHWDKPNVNASNEFGFTALPAGYRDYKTGISVYMLRKTYFWGAGNSTETHAIMRKMNYYVTFIYRNLYDKRFGASVRLVKD